MWSSSDGTLAASLWTFKSNRLTRDIVLAVVGSVLVAVSAQIEVPFAPVPMTMQVFAVLAIGLAYGARLGSATLVLYLLEGAIGLPVFALGLSGLPVLLGPTGGYLFGFVLAAFATGWLADRGWSRDLAKACLAGLAGLILIYVPGLLWLGSVIGWDKPILSLGFTPFFLVDVVKLVLAALAVTQLWRAVKQPKA